MEVFLNQESPSLKDLCQIDTKLTSMTVFAVLWLFHSFSLFGHISRVLGVGTQRTETARKEEQSAFTYSQDCDQA